jgi:hypothetical protein
MKKNELISHPQRKMEHTIVGKTSAVISQTTGQPPVEYIPTVFDQYNVTEKKQHKKENCPHCWDKYGGKYSPASGSGWRCLYDK